MKHIFSIFLFLALLFPFQAFANDVTEVRDRVTDVQAAVPGGTPSAPASMDQKGYVGEIISRLFENTGMIKTAFLIPFQSIFNSQANTLPRWNGQSFTNGSIRDTGTNIGIGTGVLSNRRVNVLGDINFSGDLYKNGVLFNPTPTNVVYTVGDQTIGGIKTFTANPMIQNSSPTTYFLDTNHRSAMVHVNSNQFYILRGAGNGSTAFSAINGRWPLQINLENNNAVFGGAGDFLGNVTSQADIGSVGNMYNYGVAYYGDDKNAIQFNDSWLRLNNASDFTSGTYTPGLLRTDGGFQVGAGGSILKVETAGNVGIGAINPTQRLDVNGKIRMRTQTVVGDGNDTVATKGYVDKKGIQEPELLIVDNGSNRGGEVSSRYVNTMLNVSGEITFYAANIDTANFLCQEKMNKQFGYWGRTIVPTRNGWRPYSNLAVTAYDPTADYGKRILCTSGSSCFDKSVHVGLRLHCFSYEDLPNHTTDFNREQ